MIPKLIHQMWIGDKPLPSIWEDRPESWKEKNPNYNYVLWDNDSIKKIDDENFLDIKVNPTHLSDYFRYKILKLHGGYYVDVDFKCLVPIDEWHEGTELNSDYVNFFGVCYGDMIQSGLIGSTKNHIIMRNILKELTKSRLAAGEVFGPYTIAKHAMEYIIKLLT